VLGLVWPLISSDQMESMKQKTQRQLYRMLSQDDLFAEIQKLSPAEILRRWVHDQVKNADRPRVVMNVCHKGSERSGVLNSNARSIAPDLQHICGATSD
jgi:hypothetical protein